MTEQERKLEIIIFIGMCKSLSDNSTFLINEFRHSKKQKFNHAIRAVDLFLKEFENELSEYNKETLVVLAEAMNDGICNLRKELREAK